MGMGALIVKDSKRPYLVKLSEFKKEYMRLAVEQFRFFCLPSELIEEIAY